MIWFGTTTNTTRSAPCPVQTHTLEQVYDPAGYRYGQKSDETESGTEFRYEDDIDNTRSSAKQYAPQGQSGIAPSLRRLSPRC